MDLKNNFFKSEYICIGGLSVLFGTFISYKIYEQIEHMLEKQKNEKNNENTQDMIQQVKDSKKKAYFILISTMIEYHQKNISGNFLDFMKQMWPKDYELIIKSKNKDSSCKRDYSQWRQIFLKVKNVIRNKK